MEKVVIIIPTYNEALIIAETIRQVFETNAHVVNQIIEVLIFDSNSTDKTQEIVQQLQTEYPRLHLKTEAEKSGLGSAYFKAMHYALNELSADIVVEFDADLSHQPKYIAPMLEAIDNCDVVVGSRYINGGSIPANWGWHRKLLSVLGNHVARFILTSRYKDFTSGFRATRAAALKKALPKEFISSQYAYKLELLWALHKNDAAIIEYPIEFIDRTEGQSKLPANSITDSLEVLFTLRFRQLKQYFTMCMVGLTGMAMQFVVYNVLRLLISPFNAAQFAVMTAIMSNFTFNNRITFKKQQSTSSLQKLKSLFWFIGYSVIVIVFQGYWLKFGIQYLGSGYLIENLIIGVGIITGSIFNYLVYSKLIWKKS